MTTGRRAGAQARPRAAERASSGGAIAGPPTRPSGPRAAAPSGAGQRLHLVGEDQVRDVALEHRVLERERHQLGVAALGEDGLPPRGDAAEGRAQVDLLEGARAEHLEVDLAGEREDRRAVDLARPRGR